MINPIVIVEDDEDDANFLADAFAEVNAACECRWFRSPVPALKYLKITKEEPLIIISDINMPLMNGLEFKRHINADILLAGKLIPFILLSTAVNAGMLHEVRSLSIQGFFKKPDNITDLDIIAKSIWAYWANTKVTPQTIA